MIINNILLKEAHCNITKNDVDRGARGDYPPSSKDDCLLTFVNSALIPL